MIIVKDMTKIDICKSPLSVLPVSVGESNRFGCCGFTCADQSCKSKLHVIERVWN